MREPVGAEGTSRDAVSALERWHDAGGVWEVVARTGSHVIVSLRRCDGGEEVDRVASDDPDLYAYLADRDSSPD